MQNWDFWMLVLGCTSKVSQFKKKCKIMIFECRSSWTSLDFSQFMKEIKNWKFKY